MKTYLRHLAESNDLTCIEIQDVQALAQAYLDHGKSAASAYEIGSKVIYAIAKQNRMEARRNQWAQRLEQKLRYRLETVKIIAANRIKAKGGLPIDQDSAALSAALALSVSGKNTTAAINYGVNQSLMVMKLNGRLKCA